MGVVVELTLDVEPLLELLTDLRLVDVCNKVVYQFSMVLCISAFRCVGLLKGGRRVLVVAIGFTESSSRQLRQFSTRRTPQGRTINDGATAGFISGCYRRRGLTTSATLSPRR